jgi:hypothetical protein
VSPFGIESIPSDVAKALRTLPLVAERLEEVAASTSEMAAMREGIDSMARDTSALTQIRRSARASTGSPA